MVSQLAEFIAITTKMMKIKIKNLNEEMPKFSYKDKADSDYKFQIRKNTDNDAIVWVYHKDIHIGKIVSRKINLSDVLGEEYTNCWQINSIQVQEDHQRKGLGTKLYELITNIAKSQKKCNFLVSDQSRSKFSESFWKKQADKGRAIYNDEIEMYIMDLRKMSSPSNLKEKKK